MGGQLCRKPAARVYGEHVGRSKVTGHMTLSDFSTPGGITRKTPDSPATPGARKVNVLTYVGGVTAART